MFPPSFPKRGRLNKAYNCKSITTHLLCSRNTGKLCPTLLISGTRYMGPQINLHTSTLFGSLWGLRNEIYFFGINDVVWDSAYSKWIRINLFINQLSILILLINDHHRSSHTMQLITIFDFFLCAGVSQLMPVSITILMSLLSWNLLRIL